MTQPQLSNLLLDQSKDLIWMIDLKFQLVYANNSYLNLMKEINGVEKKLNESIFVEDFGEGYIEKWKAYYNRALTGEYFEIEEHFYHPQLNEIQYSQVTFEPIIGDDNKFFAVACKTKEITRIVKQRSEANQLMDASLDVFCTLNEQGNFVYVSAAALHHWGYLPEELIGKPYQDFILEEDVPKTNDISAAILSGKEVKSFVNRCRKKNGGIAYNVWSSRWDANTKLMYAVARDGKEKIQQEEKIQQSEERFRALVQGGADVIGILDLEGKYSYVSPSVFSIYGFKPEDLIGKSGIEFIHPDDVKGVEGIMQKNATENRVKFNSIRFKDSKNEWRWVEAEFTNMLDNPAVKGIVVNSRDITEKVNALKQTEANDLFNRTILESSPDCLKVLDIEGRIQFMNFNGLCQMEIDDFSTVENKNWWMLWGSENEALVKASLDKALTGETVQFTAFCLTAKGTPKCWDVLVSPVGKPGEAVQQIISVSRDITEQKKEEQRLKLLESVITNTNDAILITEAEPYDEQGPRIIYVNEAFTKMTGYAAEEVIGKSPRILQGPNSNKEELAELGRKIKNWETCELTTINYKKSGEEFWIHFTLNPVADEKGGYTHWVSIERDVTEQKTKELEKELLNRISVNFNAENDYLSAAIKICKSICKFGNFDLVEVWTANREKSHMQLFSNYLADPNDEVFYEYSSKIDTFKISQSLVGKVWSQRKQLLWDDLENHNDFARRNAAKKIGLKAVLGIPLIFNDEAVGVLKIGTKQGAKHLNDYSKIFKKLELYIGSEFNRKKLENDLSHLFDSIPDILCLGNFKGKFLKINKAGCALLGYTEEEILYHSFDEFVHPEDKASTINDFKRLITDGKTSAFESRYITKSGAIIWLSWTCNSSSAEGLIYATAKNITEEKKLRELNHQANTLAKIGSWEIDFGNNSLFWSDEVHQLHETDPNSFVPNLETAINFYREDFQKPVKSDFQKCRATGDPFDFEAVILTATMKERWVRAIGNAEIVAGECIRIYGSFQDIHDRKESEHRLISLSENLPGVVCQYLVYPDGTDSLRYVSGDPKQLWGFTANEVIEDMSLIWNQIKLGGGYDDVRASILNSIQLKIKSTIRLKYVMPNGELKTHLANGTPIYMADGTILFNAIILDITKELKKEELLVQASELARIGSWEMDMINQDGDTMYWSPLIKEVLEVEDNYNTNLTGGFEFYTSESKERIKKAIAALINEGVEFDEELLLLSAKGNYRWIRAIGKGDRVENKCTKIYGSFQDIDERKKSAIKLAESENRFRTILDAEPECIKLLGPGGEVLMMNPAGLAMIEAENEEQVLGKSILDIVIPEYRAAFANVTKIVFKGNSGKLQFEIEGFKGTRRWLETNAVPLKDEQGKIISLLGVTRDITERKKAEADIRDSEEKRRLIMSGALDAIICIDVNETITFWNPQAEVIFGWKEAEVMGQQLSELIVPEPFRRFHNEGIKHYLKTGEGKVLNKLLELSAIRRGGEEFPIELTVIPVKQGQEVFFCAFIRDITHRKVATENLQKVFEEKNNILERITEAFVSLDTNWCYTYMNQKAGEIFNRDPEKMIGKHMWTEFPEGLNQPFHLAYEKAIATQQYVHVEEHYKPYDLWFENHIYPSPNGLSIFFRDVTERKKAEESILSANERFEKVTEATNDAIWDWDLVNQTYYRSQGFERFFGKGTSGLFSESELWSRDNFHSEDLEKIKNNFNEAIANPLITRWETEFRVINDAGILFYVIDRSVIIRNKEGKAIRVVGAMTDISEQKKMTIQLRELNQVLEHNAEELKRSNEELEQFAFVASHDLQEPLRMISSFMELLKLKYGDKLDEKGHQYIYFATDGSKRMKQIILDLLQFSRASRPTEKKEAIDMNDILAEFKLLRSQLIAEKQATINSNILPKLNSIKAAIIQIIHCLLDNALKYSREDTPPILEISAVENETAWEFSIKDNGIGIDPKFFNKIFVIFQRLHNREEYAGTGIGLSVAKRHIEFLGGRIWLESVPGEGTVFYFTIPKT